MGGSCGGGEYNNSPYSGTHTAHSDTHQISISSQANCAIEGTWRDQRRFSGLGSDGGESKEASTNSFAADPSVTVTGVIVGIPLHVRRRMHGDDSLTDVRVCGSCTCAFALYEVDPSE